MVTEDELLRKIETLKDFWALLLEQKSNIYTEHKISPVIF